MKAVRAVVHFQQRMWRSADWVDKTCLMIGWGFTLFCLVTLPFPDFDLPLWVFAPFLAICMFAMLRGQYRFKQEMNGYMRETRVFMRLHELYLTGGSEADLSPAEQELLKTIRAKQVLAEREPHEPGS